MQTPPSVSPPINALDLLLDAVCMVDEQGNFVYISAACERIFGYPPEEMVGRRLLELVHPDDLELTLATAQRVRAGEQIPHFENRYVRKDGEIVHIMWSARWSEEDKLRIAVARDITERKRYEATQAAGYAISEAANSAVDLDSLCAQVHQVIRQLLPMNLFSLALHDPHSGEIAFRCHRSDNGQALQSICDILTDSTLEPGSLSPADQTHWLGVPLLAQEVAFGAMVLHRQPDRPAFSDRDRTLLQHLSSQVAAAVQRVQLQSRLQFLSHHDQLTGLPNRMLLSDRLAMARERAQRQGSPAAVLFLDLDRFKAINDLLGHAIGDLLLQEVARRLRSVVRATDTVARMGGDEFVILLENLGVTEEACRVAEKVCAALSEPYQLGTQTVRCGPSIGIALMLAQAADMELVLKRADQAMYRAKELGGSRYVLAD